MTTLTPSEHPVRGVLRAAEVRGVLRATGVLGLSLALTVGVLVALASVVDRWS